MTLTIYGVVAVTFMMVMYAFKQRHRGHSSSPSPLDA